MGFVHWSFPAVVRACAGLVTARALSRDPLQVVPMRRDEALSRLKAAEPEIRAFGVGALYLFGSVSRDDAGEASDVDLFVDPSTTSFYDLGNFMGVYRRLRDALPGIEIGYSTRDGLSRHVRSSVDRDAIRVF